MPWGRHLLAWCGVIWWQRRYVASATKKQAYFMRCHLECRDHGVIGQEHKVDWPSEKRGYSGLNIVHSSKGHANGFSTWSLSRCHRHFCCGCSLRKHACRTDCRADGWKRGLLTAKKKRRNLLSWNTKKSIHDNIQPRWNRQTTGSIHVSARFVHFYPYLFGRCLCCFFTLNA